MKIDDSATLDNRFRTLLIEKRGEITRDSAAKKLSIILGRPVPKTTYAGYETNRNPPRDVLVALIELYNLEPWQLLGINNK